MIVESIAVDWTKIVQFIKFMKINLNLHPQPLRIVRNKTAGFSSTDEFSKLREHLSLLCQSFISRYLNHPFDIGYTLSGHKKINIGDSGKRYFGFKTNKVAYLLSRGHARRHVTYLSSVSG